jgi:hypothetical protein
VIWCGGWADAEKQPAETLSAEQPFWVSSCHFDVQLVKAGVNDEDTCDSV